MQGLTFAWHSKHELLHLSNQLSIRDSSCTPPVHAEVALRVKVAIREQASLTPPMQGLTLLVVEQGNNTFLVVHVSLFANEWALHLVDWLLEELLILPDEQLLDVLKAVSSLRDRVDLNAFDQNLN